MKISSDARARSAESLFDGLSAKAEYRRLCETERSIPLFSTDWWLDAAAGPDHWDVVLVKGNGTIVGAMPFATTRRFGMDLIRQPPLTPVLGPWIRANGETASARLSNEQKIMQSLIEQLPRFDHFRQTWNRSLSNWLPFYWNGFGQTTEYTYVIPALHDLDALWSELDISRRKHCKSGIERHKLRLREDLPLDAFLALHRMTLENRGVSQSFTDDCLRRIDAACLQRNRRKILIVVDETGRYCAGTYTVWDGNSAYALIKGADPDMRHSPLLHGLDASSRFYFCHAYHVVCSDAGDLLASTDYGGDVAAIVQHGNVYGVQFHPEKSHRFGMALLRNFAGI